MKIDPSVFSLGTSIAAMAQEAAMRAPALPAAIAPAGGAGTPQALPDFLQVFEGAVLSVDARTQAAGERMRAVELGQSDDLVGAMLASQEAGLSFSMLMQVRNKVMGAVDEIVKLQV